MKSYIIDSLGNDERIESSAKVTYWIVYFCIVESLCTLLALHFLSKIDILQTGIIVPTPWGGIKASLLLILFLMSFIGIMQRAIRTLIYALTTEIAITNLRIIYKTGLIRRYTYEVRTKRIEGANVSQTVMGRIFNYGDLLVTGTGSNNLNIRYIDEPLEFRRSLLNSISIED